MSRLSAALDSPRESYVLGLVRVLLALLLLAAAGKAWLTLQTAGYFGDHFHVSLLPPSWVPSAASFQALLLLQAVAAGFALWGHWTRPALLIAAAVGTLPFFWDRLSYHNNRYVLCLFAFILALAPSDRSFRIGRTFSAEARRAPLWAMELLKLQVSIVYLASAGSKLLDADWRGGQVLHLRYVQGASLLSQASQQVPSALLELLRAPLFAELTSKAAIATELFLACALWLGRTRAAALWLGLGFHLGIELFARVESFSFMMAAAYLAFVAPELRERRVEYHPNHGPALALVRWVRRLDWLARFELLANPELTGRWGVCVVDREGRRHGEKAALAALCRGLPAFFPLWPLAAWFSRSAR